MDEQKRRREGSVLGKKGRKGTKEDGKGGWERREGRGQMDERKKERKKGKKLGAEGGFVEGKK